MPMVSQQGVLSGVRSYLFDLDGCIWFGAQLAPGARELVRALRDSGKSVHFATNISSQNPLDIAQKLTRLGIRAEAEDVVAPLRIVANHPVLRKAPRAYVIGKPVVEQTLRDRGIEVVSDPHRAAAVVVGRDPDFSYERLSNAIKAVDSGAVILALCMDLRGPDQNGAFVEPAAGVFARAVAAASGLEPVLVGKPSSFFFEQALRELGLDRRETVMVGDSLDSDIAGGYRAGLRTVLVGDGYVSCGNSDTEQVEPDLTVDGLIELRSVIEETL